MKSSLRAVVDGEAIQYLKRFLDRHGALRLAMTTAWMQEVEQRKERLPTT